MNAFPVEEEAKQRLIQRGNWITISDETPPCTCIDPVAKINTLLFQERAGKIFGLRYEGSVYYASYQFDANGCAIPIVEEILRILSSRMNEWAIAAWFDFPNSWILDHENGVPHPRRPQSALDRRDSLLYAASNAKGTYVA